MTVSSILHHVSNLVRHHWLIYNQTRWHWFIYNYDYWLRHLWLQNKFSMRSASLEEHLSDQSVAYRIIQMSKRRNPSVAVNQHRLCTTPESSVAQQMNLVSWSKLGLIRPISDPVLAAFALITDKLRSRWIRSRLSRRHRLLLSLTHHSARVA